MSALWWWLVVQVVALCATPLCLALFRPLADRGYGLSKAFGLLLFGYGTWLLVVLHLLPNSRITYLVVLALIAGGSAWLWRREGPGLLTFWRQRRGLLLLEEGIFLCSYLGFLFIRSHNADIAATEKFMDFAFMNAVARSTSFPPLDPWLAPSPTVPHPTINYYYFGYLVQGLLLKLSGVLPAEAFNFALSLLFALAFTGAFSLGYTLTRDIWAETRLRVRSPKSEVRNRGARGRAADGGPTADRGALINQGATAERLPAGTDSRATAALPSAGPFWSLRTAWPYVGGGLLTSYLLLIAGNLWSALRRFDGSGVWEKDFWSGLGWNATRVLVIKQGTQDVDYTINEFPSFSFLLGDLHPHVLALPFVLVAVGVAYAWLMRPPRLFRWAIGREPLNESGQWSVVGGQWSSGQGEPTDAEDGPPQRAPVWQVWRERVAPFAEVLPGAMILGSLYCFNSWDLPAYFLLAQVGAIAGAWWLWRRSNPSPTSAPEEAAELDAAPPSPSLVRTLGAVIVVGVLAVSLFLPFYLTFKPPVVSEAGRVPLGLVPIRSLMSQFLQFWGVQLLLVVPAVLAAVAAAPEVRRSLAGSISRARATAIVAREAAGWEPALLLGAGALLIVVASRLGSGVLVLCTLLAIGSGWAALRALDPGSRLGGRPLAFAFAAVGLAALLVATCEVVYIRDFYGGALRRMNTVFKFYYEAWLLFAIGGTAVVTWLLRRLKQRRAAPGGDIAYWAFTGAVALLFLATLLFPYRVTLLRTDNFRNPATLDGMDWMRRYHPEDYAAAQWLREHAATPDNATPVILEATDGPYSEFARMATQTGFPTILGWDQHERLWRGASINAEVDTRKQDVDAIYNAATLAQAKPLLDKYHVAYVVIGYLEMQKYGGATPEEHQRLLSRFDAMAAQGLQVAFQQGETRIYKVPKTS